MLIIAGRMYVPPEERDSWVEAHDDAIRRARAMPGCLELYLSADPIDKNVVNMFERWETEEQLEAWRAVANPPPRPKDFKADVYWYEISSMGPPFR